MKVPIAAIQTIRKDLKWDLFLNGDVILYITSTMSQPLTAMVHDFEKGYHIISIDNVEYELVQPMNQRKFWKPALVPTWISSSLREKIKKEYPSDRHYIIASPNELTLVSPRIE